MMALKRILVATDFSAPANVACAYGRDLTRQYDATLHVIHVIENAMAYYGSEGGFALADVERHVEVSAREQLDAVIASNRDDRMTVVAAVMRASNIAHAITEYARKHGIDLIIVGTHGRGAVSRFLTGSIAERVVRSAPCPVLTVRAHARHFVDVPDDQQGAPDNLVESTSMSHH